ncbi:hypothetical protein AVEN_252396-1 [Araneus ventricosus]|uniref:Uncharacterized protein n=1 Tax=Araneus ventricosus TaxID=182803 RepID=A0A4Y2ART0_ARAVE|nr:hypothetical protein AVEN_252396-1 [Araneus ventricosus]
MTSASPRFKSWILHWSDVITPLEKSIADSTCKESEILNKNFDIDNFDCVFGVSPLRTCNSKWSPMDIQTHTVISIATVYFNHIVLMVTVALFPPNQNTTIITS